MKLVEKCSGPSEGISILGLYYDFNILAAYTVGGLCVCVYVLYQSFVTTVPTYEVARGWGSRAGTRQLTDRVFETIHRQILRQLTDTL